MSPTPSWPLLAGPPISHFSVKPHFLLHRTALLLGAFVGLSASGADTATQPALAPDRATLLLELKFDGNASDSSPAKRPCQVVGPLTFPAGQVGQGARLDGSCWLETGLRAEDLGDEFTVECWVNPAPNQGLFAGLFGNETRTGNGFTLDQDGAQLNHYTANFGTGDGSYLKTEPVPLAAGVWQHIAYTKTKQGNAFFLNGLRVAEVKSDRRMVASPGVVCLGRGGSGVPPFQGVVDEVRVWRRALLEFSHAGIGSEQSLRTLGRLLRLEVSPGPEEPAGGSLPPLLRVALSGAQVRPLPPDVTQVRVAVSARHMTFAGQDAEVRSLPDLVLERGAGFRADLPSPLALGSGCWRLRFTPGISAGGGQVEGTATAFTVVVPERVQALPSSSPTHPTGGTTDQSLARRLDGPWRVRADPDNQGRGAQWFEAIPKEAVPASVPGTMQQTFPGYHGVAWYWVEFEGQPLVPNHRCRLWFGAVDHYAEVWLNGRRLGDHEGAEGPFDLETTGAYRPAGRNLLAVRVINPGNQDVDGFRIGQVPHSFKRSDHYGFGDNANSGGLLGPVELRFQPAVRVTDLFARPDHVSGQVRLQLTVENSTAAAVPCRLTAGVQRDDHGRMVPECLGEADTLVQPGVAHFEFNLRVATPQLWSPQHPRLYSAAVRLEAQSGRSNAFSQEASARFGFRDFRVGPDGFFRLNGRRLFLKSCHTVNNFPVALGGPHRPEMMTRDLLYAKAMGFDMVRFLGGPPFPEQLDFCDRIGLMIYAESRAAWQLDDSPWMAERFNRALGQMILRDRNHPCVAIWGLLNETENGPVFRQAVNSLPLVRALDDTRLVLLHSGRQFDQQLHLGSLANPGSKTWEYLWGDESPGATNTSPRFGVPPTLGDLHTYPWVPHTPDQIRSFRTMSGATKPVFLSEYGVGSLVNPFRLARLHEQDHSPTNAEDFTAYRRLSQSLVADLRKFGMDRVFLFPEDLVSESERLHVRHRTVGYNALRANPRLCGYSLTGIIDQPAGEGLMTEWRELKLGIMDGMVDCLAPLRWCLFVEPLHLYANRPCRLEAVLANDGVLGPGEYPARFKLRGPAGVVWEKTVRVKIPAVAAPEEVPLATPVLAETVTFDGPAGTYTFAAELEQGGAARGGRLECYVSRTNDLPRVTQPVAVLGLSERARGWLTARGAQTADFNTEAGRSRRVILVGDVPRQPSPAATFRALARQIAGGASVVFLEPAAVVDDTGKTKFLPLHQPGHLRPSGNWVYHREDVVKLHPIFEGLPAGGVMDWYYFGPLVPDRVFEIPQAPDDTVVACFGLGNAGAGVQNGYDSGLLLGAYRFGAGTFTLSTLRLLEHLDSHPAADRLLLNLVRHASNQSKPAPVELPADFDAQLQRLGL